MKKKLLTILGIAVLLLSFSYVSMAQRHHLAFPAAIFHGANQSTDYVFSGNTIFKPVSPGSIFAPVIFPDSANGLQITRLSSSVIDDSPTGGMTIYLIKVDRWTGIGTTVGSLASGIGPAEGDIRYLNIPKSQISARGIDNNRWAWYLQVYYSEGGANLYLYQITIRYE